ncbi:GntP family permease [Halarchaeum nitratireducens]|uniref:Gluconate permease n=1 Tax=Halarchaeum nitratireducens TaxID=489913 RepID=A0A830GD53_9EURY|nr:MULTISPECIES: GntP family permease [Halarchaeum]MBP2252381.1 GntP family gluconate:H+ symporter [Halarchaeum solikamskense]GGN20413.1 gluconate permease [Halarchaeum nitratireducens]
MPAALPALTALAIGVIVVVLLLVVLDLPAFVGLVISAFTVGLVNALLMPDVAFGSIPGDVATAFGNNMAGIGIPILMAAIIGKSMTESGAANRVVRSFQSLVSDDNADFALWGSSTVLAIPVFFDNVFYLMAPLARSMRARIGDNYALYIAVVGGGGTAAHAFIPPTPGPLAVAQKLGAGESILGMTIVVGLATAIPAALIAGVAYGRFINERVDIPLRESMGTTAEDLENQAQKPIESLPGFFESLLPILVAVLFIAAGTFVDTFSGSYPSLQALDPLTNFIGDANFALTVAAMVAAITYLRMDDFPRQIWQDELTEALQNGGNIAAITAAGGAFGAMLAASGIGMVIANALSGLGIGLLITAWLIAAIVRIAQGSATVAMITTGGIMAPLVPELTVHPAYLVMAIGAGGITTSWYNDSGFWIVKEIGGLTQSETFKTWTAVTSILSVAALIIVLVYSTILPLA